MRILITGATGFIGTYLINHLNKKNHIVIGLSRKTNYKQIKKISIRSKAKLNDFFHKNKFDIVIHLDSVIKECKPLQTFEENCIPTINLLECCVENKIKKFIFASTHLVYGKTQYLPIDESHLQNPEKNYPLSKLIIENLCRMYSISYGLDVIILRISSVYGEGQLDNLVITNLMSSCIQDKHLTIHKYKNGFQLMDLVHVSDVCNAFELACNSKIKFGIFNVASGKAITALDIAKKLSNISGITKIKIKKINQHTNHFFYDISSIKTCLKFKPTIELNEKILKPWYNQYLKNFN